VQILFAVLGVSILLALLLEVLWTTMGLGGGFLTRFISGWLHRATLWLYWRTENRLVLAWAGIWIVMIIFAIWVALLWLGWTLIFLAGPTAVVNTQTGELATFWDRVYLVGFSIFTLGLGDFRPEGVLWQLLTALATVHGLFTVTLVITYLLSVVQAATQMRQLAVTITSLGGCTDQEILMASWNGESCSSLGDHLVNLTPALAQLQQRHLTYPILSYFHSVDEAASLAVSIVALDEALTVLEYGMEDACGLSPMQYRPMRRILSDLLQTLHVAYIEPAELDPPLPSLEAFAQAGLPVTDEDSFRKQLERLSLRRRLLHGFLLSDGVRWSQLPLLEKNRSSGSGSEPHMPI
jgi:hypothetical protein